MLEHPSLGVRVLSKSRAVINGYTFHDFEITSKNNEVYSYFLFFNKNKRGYLLNASISTKLKGSINKTRYQKLFKSFKVN
jgi:hypothetical protein